MVERTDPLHGLHARAARAAEDPVEMTLDARLTQLARLCAEIIRENPSLTPAQVAKAARLRMKEHMAQLGRLSAAARARKAES